MSKFFECVHCGAITPVEMTPPKCRSCGHGTGVLHLKDPRNGSEKAGDKDKTADQTD